MVTRLQKCCILGGSLVITYPLLTGALMPIYRRRDEKPTRTAIVTGATGNLGASLTFAMARRKMRVIMACRDMDKCKGLRREIVLATGFKGLACRHLDLEDINSINKFADEMIATEPHIDILVNLAAVKHVENKEMTKYGIEKNYFVNFLAPMLLTFRLMDKLRESSEQTRDSRIINVIGKPRKTWNVDLNDINFEERKYTAEAAYKQSKLALAYFTILLDKFNREKKNCIYVFGTNPVSHNITRSFYRPCGFKEQLTFVLENYFALGPDRAIAPATRCALEDTMTEERASGRLYGLFLRPWGWGEAGKDETKAKLVWNSALDMVSKARN